MNGNRAISWFADNALNGLAYLSLVVAPPLRAKIWVERAAAIFPRITTIGDARRLCRRLGARGTCLSRSLAVAARCPGSQVVIGVFRPQRSKEHQTPFAPRSVGAHAWVEIGGVALPEEPNSLWVEVGRMDLGKAARRRN
jgi:hypothetical protein